MRAAAAFVLRCAGVAGVQRSPVQMTPGGGTVEDRPVLNGNRLASAESQSAHGTSSRSPHHTNSAHLDCRRDDPLSVRRRCPVAAVLACTRAQALSRIVFSSPAPQLSVPRFRLTPVAALPWLSAAANSDTQRPTVIEYSDAYRMRRNIHKYASFATLPLFGTELWLGQSLYSNTPSDQSSRRGAHAAIGAGIMALFGVNTVTGAWNLFGEGRKDPHGRRLRLVHGLLMMAADAGFVATSLSGPNGRRQREALTYEADKATHRNLAIASISVGTAGYLVMLFGNR